MWLCEKQTLQGQRDMKGVLGAVLAVHSVIVCVRECVCLCGAQMDCTKVTWREEKTHVAREMDLCIKTC